MAHVKSYQDLIAWQKAISLVTDVYTITTHFRGRKCTASSASCAVHPYRSRAMSPKVVTGKEQKTVVTRTDELGGILNDLIASLEHKKSKPQASLTPNH